MKPIEDLRLSHTGGIMAMINSLAAKENVPQIRQDDNASPLL